MLTQRLEPQQVKLRVGTAAESVARVPQLGVGLPHARLVVGEFREFLGDFLRSFVKLRGGGYALRPSKSKKLEKDREK